jgi:hypothetical protein
MPKSIKNMDPGTKSDIEGSISSNILFWIALSI